MPAAHGLDADLKERGPVVSALHVAVLVRDDAVEVCDVEPRQE